VFTRSSALGFEGDKISFGANTVQCTSLLF
jgi:hypothetical protein